MRKIAYSIIPTILFFLSIFYLMSSGLTISKAIKVQNEVFLIFIKTLTEKDILLAVSNSLHYIFTEVVLLFLPFLFLLGSSFFLVFLFKKEINYLHLIPMQIPFLLLALYLSAFSTAIFLTYAGFLLSLFLLKTFEPGKTAFLTGNSLISKHSRIVFIFLAIGFFLSLYLNFESYKQDIISGTYNLVELIASNISKVQQEQTKVFVDQCTEGMKIAINQSYQAVPSPAKETCEPVYSSIIAGIDGYKQEAIEQIENITISEERIQEFVMKSFPIFEQTTKATPLILSVLVYSFLEVLKVFIAPVFGFIYFVTKKKK